MKFLDFLSDADKEYIENYPQEMLMKSAFTINTALGGIIQASMIDDRLNGKHLMVTIDNSSSVKTSDDGGVTLLQKNQVDDLIKALMILRRAMD
jgi:hypothetical protein